MKATKIFMMAALALIFAACSNNDDNDFAQQPIEQPANGEITITATLEANDGASTRALQDPDGENKIASTWATTDQFAILYKSGTDYAKSIATVDKIDGTTVTITFTIPASLASNTACTIVYPASAAKADNTGADVATALAAQDGTIGNCPEVRVGTATIDKDNHNLTSVTKLEAQNAIFKFTLSGQSIDATHPLVIKKGENDVVTTVTPASSTTSVYVAMPPAASSTYRFIVTTDDNKYIKSGTAAITAGNYYQTTLDLSTARYPLALSSATEDDLGSVIASDGKIYENTTSVPGGSTARAMIAYVGDAKAGGTGAATCAHGLAIALDEVGTTQYYWLESAGLVSTWATSNTVTGISQSTTTGWRLPTVDDFKYMFQGCGGDAYSADMPAGMTAFNCGTLDTKVYNLTGKHLKFCWTSNESETSCGYYYNFDAGKLCSQSGGNTCYVRAVLAF